MKKKIYILKAIERCKMSVEWHQLMITLFVLLFFIVYIYADSTIIATTFLVDCQ